MISRPRKQGGLSGSVRCLESAIAEQATRKRAALLRASLLQASLLQASLLHAFFLQVSLRWMWSPLRSRHRVRCPLPERNPGCQVKAYRV